MNKYLIIGLMVMMVIISGCSSEPLGLEQYDTLAQCLTDKGVAMFGTEWCSHCQNQKRAFGDSFQYINFIDCDQNRGSCTAAGVQGYPTWKINEQNYPGEQSLDRLAALAGCELTLS